MNEDEVRQKYIEEVRQEKEWRVGAGGVPEDHLNSTLKLQCTCACRVHQAITPHPSTTPLLPSTPLNARAPFLPPSPTSTIYTPHHSSRDITIASFTPKTLKFNVTPDRSSGQFRKLSSPTLQDMENKENQMPVATPAFESASRRRCSRRSSLFTPSFKKLAHAGGGEEVVTPYRKLSHQLPDSKKIKKLEETGQGRIIPIKQGYLYKKSGSSRMYRRKYVTLCSDGTMTYYPSFQAYVDNLHSKEIHLQHVTVKIPGQKPTGLKSAASATPAPTEILASSSSDEFDKEVITYEATSEKKVENTKTPKRKRHRLSEESGPETSSLFELVIVSLDSRQWQFQLCSQEEGEEWVTAIQKQIHSSLRGSPSAWTAGGNTETDVLRSVAGNDECADCGVASPAWASLNLGTLICIECSGIHRNLGTHISKVRSLDLDSWSTVHLDLMQRMGNEMGNNVWEYTLRGTGNTSIDSLQFWNKPGPDSSREDKENFIKSKYLSKNFVSEAQYTKQDLVNAMER